tara:strand:+ start:120 stop:356 length:237 start_codon:yes stop_codon:yes gene_type:complete
LRLQFRAEGIPSNAISRTEAGGCMKPRIRPSAFAKGRWQCRGGPMKHGEYLTGYGNTPNEAWLVWRVKQLEYQIAEGL